MTDWTVHLEFEAGTSSKFWRARVEGKTLYVNYGKIGSTGQTQVKDLSDPAAAKAEYDKLVRDKRKKGYVDTGAGGAGEGAGDDDDADDRDDEDASEDDDDAPRARKPSKPAAAAPASKPAPPAAASSAPGHHLVLDAGGRKAETTLYLDGKTVRMDARETYASPDAANKVFERLRKLLGGEGYKDG
jgi:predicted DNA-binding WGR domain protein